MQRQTSVLETTVRHNFASLVMPNSDPRDRFFKLQYCSQVNLCPSISFVLIELIAESNIHNILGPGPEVIKHFSCSTQLSMKFFLLINVKMPTVVGIVTCISRKNSILGLSESEKS